MNKFKKGLLFIVLTMLLFTGCSMKQEMGFIVNSDKKVSLKLIMAMDNEMIDSILKMDENEQDSEKAITDEQRWAYLEKNMTSISNYKKEKYEENGYKGFVYTTDAVSLDSVSSTTSSGRVDISGTFEDDSVSNKVLFIKDGDKYISNMKYTANSDTDYSQYQSMGAVFDMNFVITLPNESIKNNADKVEDGGKKLSWSLLKSHDIELEFTIDENSKNNGNNNNNGNNDNKKDDNNSTTNSDSTENENKGNNDIILFVGIGAGIVLVILIIILLTRKKQTPTTNEMPINNNTTDNINITIEEDENKPNE